MPTLSPLQVAAFAKVANWPQAKIPWVVGVTFAESSWNTDAIGGPNSRGERWYGLGQNSDVHRDKFPNFFPPSEIWKDPVSNLAVMKAIYDAQGEGAWAPSDNQARRNAMAQGVIAANQVASITDKAALLKIAGYSKTLADLPVVGGLVRIGEDPVGAAVNGAGPVAGGAEAATGALGWITANLGSALWIGGGVVLVLVGGLLLAKSEVLGGVGKVLAA